MQVSNPSDINCDLEAEISKYDCNTCGKEKKESPKLPDEQNKNEKINEINIALDNLQKNKSTTNNQNNNVLLPKSQAYHKSTPKSLNLESSEKNEKKNEPTQKSNTFCMIEKKNADIYESLSTNKRPSQESNKLSKNEMEIPKEIIEKINIIIKDENKKYKGQEKNKSQSFSIAENNEDQSKEESKFQGENSRNEILLKMDESKSPCKDVNDQLSDIKQPISSVNAVKNTETTIKTTENNLINFKEMEVLTENPKTKDGEKSPKKSLLKYKTIGEERKKSLKKKNVKFKGIPLAKRQTKNPKR